MKNETTPPVITPEIRRFCKEISDAEPSYVVVAPAPGMAIQNCFVNVSSIVDQVGGAQVNGWVIWQFANVYIYFEAHSVWKNEVNTLIDPTPHIGGETRILFLPDSTVEYHGHKIPGKRMPLTDSPLAEEYIKLVTEMEHFLVNDFTGEKVSPMDPLYPRLSHAHKRSQELLAVFKSDVGRNEPCPCGSGLKYKKCCGKYDL